MENKPHTSYENEQNNNHEQAALDALVLAREQGVGILHATQSDMLDDDAVSAFLTQQTESESDYKIAHSINVDLTDSQFGPVEFAGKNGVNAFRIIEGEAVLRTLRKKDAREMVVSEGDVVILDAQDETYFSLSADGAEDSQLVVASYRNKQQDISQYNRERHLMSNDSVSIRHAIAIERSKSAKAKEKWEKYTERQKNRKRSIGRKVIDMFTK